MVKYNPIVLKQGDDKNIYLPALDSENYPIDISACTEMRASLRINNQEVYKYSLTPQLGYGSIIVDGTYNNMAILQIQREQSKDFNIGKITVAIDYQFTGTNPSGFRHYEEVYDVGEVKSGLLRAEQIP